MALETSNLLVAQGIDLESQSAEPLDADARVVAGPDAMNGLQLDVGGQEVSTMVLQVLGAVSGESIVELSQHEALDLLVSDVRALVTNRQDALADCGCLLHGDVIVADNTPLRALWPTGKNLVLQFAATAQEPPHQQQFEKPLPLRPRNGQRICNQCGKAWELCCTEKAWETALGGKKCFDRDDTCFTECCPTLVCCLVIPFGLGVGLLMGEIVPAATAFAAFWAAACLTCLCTPGFASYHHGELQGDYDEGTGVEGTLVHISAVWCCTLTFVGASLIIYFHCRIET